jgi:transposase
MEQTRIGDFSDLKRLASLSKDEVIVRYELVYDELQRAIKDNYELRSQKLTDSQINLILEEQLGDLRDKMFGASSERYKKSEKPKEPKPAKPRVQRPSERYPNLPKREVFIAVDPMPPCGACGHLLSDSGMTEDSEQLTVIPKKHEIIVQKRMICRCEKCHGDMQTAPAPPRILEGSSYSDEMIIDVSLTKYCDLIPIDRYSAMAARSGVKDLPPNSLTDLTHHFADFVIGAHLKNKELVMAARVMNADETPHRMLEGSDKKSWYLWGFSTPQACYFECHDTRSGDVASEILINSRCQVLLTDVYCGYDKAIRIANAVRSKLGLPLIKGSNCNAHSRRYFFRARQKYTLDAEFFLDHYHEIYQLNDACKEKPPDEVLALREQMRPRFEAMKQKCWDELPKFPNENKFAKAMRYFLNNYEGLTLFLTDAEVQIDNNSQERAFRSHCVGRKTWYGTHSERGARTAAILFSLVESCKLNKVNPREYFKRLVDDLLHGRPAFTPYEFKSMASAN